MVVVDLDLLYNFHKSQILSHASPCLVDLSFHIVHCVE